MTFSRDIIKDLEVTLNENDDPSYIVNTWNSKIIPCLIKLEIFKEKWNIKCNIEMNYIGACEMFITHNDNISDSKIYEIIDNNLLKKYTYLLHQFF